MNIQNIGTLSNSLQALGFEDTIASQLLKNISFKPSNFIIHQRMVKGNDVMNFHLTFEKNGDSNSYSPLYYDAVFRKEIEIPNININGIDMKELDKRMAEINWTSAFRFQERKKLQLEDKTAWFEEEKIESIVTDLQTLESAEEGKQAADCLKMKFWCDLPVQEMINNLSSLRSKFEINQRFYFFEGQSGISVEEAYRFLYNRWMEKQLLAKRKQIDVSKAEDQLDGNAKASSDKNLLQKKMRNKNNKVKS
jgi:hypothetical protein